MRFGSYLRHYRLDVSGVTLREFARHNAKHAGNLSRIERSLILPGAVKACELMESYGIEQGSPLWEHAWKAYCLELIEHVKAKVKRP